MWKLPILPIVQVRYLFWMQIWFNDYCAKKLIFSAYANPIHWSESNDDPFLKKTNDDDKRKYSQ